MNLIGIHGLAESGKDTVAKIIKEINSESNWEIRKFGFKLKQIASILTGIPIEMFEDQTFKKSYLDDRWNILKKTDHTLIKNGEAVNEYVETKMTVRDFLQKLGTDAIRNGLHPDTWVIALFNDYKKIKNEDEEYINPNWLISDLRFVNEYESIKQKNGICIKVHRDVDESDYLMRTHSSETSLDGYDFDYVIDNTKSLNHLRDEVKKVIKYFNLNKQ